MGKNRDSLLLQRLRRIRQQKQTASEMVSLHRVAERQEAVLEPAADWQQIDDYLLFRTTAVPLKSEEIMPQPRFFSNRCVNELLFFDLETTGLGGGSGVTPFLAGLMQVFPAELRVCQFFMADYPGEKAMLIALEKIIANGRLLISYNGRSYDWPLLCGRYIMNRLPPPQIEQLDLLHPVRAIWRRRLSNCTLSTVERDVLSICRVNDIESALIPQKYFNYLKNRDVRYMSDVFSHHLQDMVSLYFLLKRLEQEAAHPGKRQPVPNFYQLGRYVARFDIQKARIIRQQGVAADEKESLVAAALYLRRQGSYRQMARLWLRLWRCFKESAFAVELAKYYEHRHRDRKAAFFLARHWALQAARVGGHSVDSKENQLIRKRLDRLARRIIS